MSVKSKSIDILSELKNHVPFTSFGALTGVAFMLLFRNIDHKYIQALFYVFHPAHVVLSAVVTAAMFRIHSKKTNLLSILVVGYIGSVGIATLSDSVVPYIGEVLLGMHAHKHIGFIEGWYIVNPAAIAGSVVGYLWPRTKFSHAGHVLLSTWASSLHMIMAMSGQIGLLVLMGCFVFLFLAVWLPCCISDIVFPVFVANQINKAET